MERIYATFPRLAERKGNGGGQLSGSEQQMLAISRALLQNPKLLVMDEPTEGLAPVIVAQVEEMLLRLAEEGEIDVLVIEQNIGVACGVADTVAIMVNGRINRTAPARELAADRDLQQRLLGVGRHGHDDTHEPQPAAAPAGGEAARPPAKIYLSNPKRPTRWSQPAPVGAIERAARLVTTALALRTANAPELRPLAAPGAEVVLVAGTLDTKGEELRYIRDLIRAAGIPVRMVDLSTSGAHSGAEIPAHQIAAWHPRGAAGVFTGDRGASVAGMTEAFSRWIVRQEGIAGIMMMHSVADVQGLNAIAEDVPCNAAQAMIGMVWARETARPRAARKPAIGSRPSSWCYFPDGQRARSGGFRGHAENGGDLLLVDLGECLGHHVAA